MNESTLALAEGRDPDADAYWRALAGHEIQLRRCTRCGTHFALPLPSCPECGGEPEVTTAAGTGELYTWVVVRHAFDDVLAQQVPYVVGAVDLDEGARLFARVEGVELEQLEPGLRLRATFPEESGCPPIVFVPEGGGK